MQSVLYVFKFFGLSNWKPDHVFVEELSASPEEQGLSGICQHNW